jgi:hypothetical protein
MGSRLGLKLKGRKNGLRDFSVGHADKEFCFTVEIIVESWSSSGTHGQKGK